MKSVKPLSVAVFDNVGLITSLQAVSSIDLSSNAKQPAESLILLGRLFNRTTDDFKLMANTPEVYKHLHFGFVVAARTEHKNLWLEHVDLALSVFEPDKVSEGYVILATGSLREWKTALVENLVPSRSAILRDQLKQVLTYFDNYQLTACFNEYRRQYDQSLYLERK